MLDRMRLERNWPDTASQTPDGHLQIGGCDVPALAQRHGTPLYILDEATVRATAAAYRAALEREYPAPASVHYAAKALLNIAVAQLMVDCGLGLDCVSFGELGIAQCAGIDFAKVHLHGNAKPPLELERALRWGVSCTIVDSLDELEVLGRLTANRAEPHRIMLRVNPGIDVHTHAHIQTGQLDSKFGLPIATGMAEAAVRRALELPGLRLVGLHMHLGSQITEIEPLERAIALLFEWSAELRDRYNWTMTEWSPGGGLGVSYRAGDPTGDIDEYVRLIARVAITSAERTNQPLPRMFLEPGRSMIARAVVAVYSVMATKNIPDVRRFVAVDGGMGDNIRPALYEARYDVIRADADAPPTQTVTVVGRYCESGDVLLRDVELPAVEPGALLAVPMCGAYTLSMASNYNLVGRPPLVLVRDGQDYVLQRRENLTDLTARDEQYPTDDERPTTNDQ